MSEVQVGRVKWFNGSRGFGFITNLSSNEDIFVHHSSLVINTTEQTDFWKTLYQGEYVQFSVSTEEEKQQAVSVTGIQSGPLQCESRPRRRFQRRRTLSDTNTDKYFPIFTKEWNSINSTSCHIFAYSSRHCM